MQLTIFNEYDDKYSDMYYFRITSYYIFLYLYTYFGRWVVKIDIHTQGRNYVMTKDINK